MIPLVALSFVALLGISTLAVDLGYWRFQQRLQQNAADSASIAGAVSLAYSTDVTTAARTDASTNGFTDDNGVTVSVSVDNPPAAGAYAGNNNAVEAIVKKKQPVFFAGIFGLGFQWVSARAVAVLSSTNAGCIYVLKGGLSGNLVLHGGGRGGITTTPLCGLVVNGNLDVTGQANVDVSYAAYAGTGPKGGSYPHGQPTHTIAGTDPCMRLAGCAYLATLETTHPGLFSAACQDSPAGGGTLPANPLPPGHYCYGPYSSTVTLQSGLFIMDKGMFAGQTAGNGVTIYNNCTGSCSTTLNGGNVNDSIVAPLTGPTAGMVYYQPPNLQNSVTVNGAAGTVQAIGGIYAPGASFTFNGQLPTISFLVAGSITMNGGGLNAGTAGGFPVPASVVLAE